jgi:hypothetical protein
MLEIKLELVAVLVGPLCIVGVAVLLEHFQIYCAQRSHRHSSR